jgi:hypothetical protein
MTAGLPPISSSWRQAPWHGPRRNTATHCCSSIFAVRTCFFAKPLLSNGSCIFAYLAVVVQQRVYYMLQYYTPRSAKVNRSKFGKNHKFQPLNLI